MKRILLCVLLLGVFSGEALAADYPIIIETKLLAPIGPIVNLLGGAILDHIPGTGIYLLKVPVIPSLLPSLTLQLLGVISIELDKTIFEHSSVRWGVVTVDGPADWYKMQPQFQRVGLQGAQTYSRGANIVVADINSKTDFAHPALAGHLTGGHDFVASRAGYQGTLNQSSAAFLDQSSAAFLDQSSAAFLDQSSAAFLDQSSAAFLDDTAMMLVDNGNPAYSHGTLCAGIIAAIAPESTVMPLRVFDDTGRTDAFSVAKAIYYAANNGAKVINMSFGMGHSYNAINKALAYASSKGVQVITSAGNANTSVTQYPASVSTVISVAATDITDKKASFSNYGTKVYVSAPGVNIISAYPGGYYAIVSGTSFSAPIVAAETAMIMSAKPASNAKTVIGAAVVNIDAMNPAYIGKLGKGRIDLLKAAKP